MNLKNRPRPSAKKRRPVLESQSPEALLILKQALLRGGRNKLSIHGKYFTDWNNVTLGNKSSLEVRRKFEKELCKSHILSDLSLEQKENQLDPPFITCADLEESYHNFILCGHSEGSISVFDASKVSKSNNYLRIRHVKGSKRESHKHAISCIQWYPIDNGLFTSSSCDDEIKVWDPSSLMLVDQFKLNCHVNHHNMSAIATQHTLIAASGNKGIIFLCDLKSGSATHTLQGHNGAVLISKWSKQNQFELLSAGEDRTVRLWDVRSGKSCLQILGQENLRGSRYEVELARRKKQQKIQPLSHSSRIISLEFTYDGLYLISFSYDGQCKVWNTSSWEELGQPFHGACTNSKSFSRICVTRNISPDIVFIPCYRDICAYEVQTGDLVNVMQGHLSSIFGVIFNPHSYSLYSYGKDKNFLIWTPSLFCNSKVDELEENLQGTKSTSFQAGMLRKDTWSSDED